MEVDQVIIDISCEMSARLSTLMVKDDWSDIDERSINMSSAVVFTLCLLVSSADNFCKQLGPRSDRPEGPDYDTNCLTEFFKSIDF